MHAYRNTGIDFSHSFYLALNTTLVAFRSMFDLFRQYCQLVHLNTSEACWPLPGVQNNAEELPLSKMC
jgi:hypothetical protein